MRVGNVSGRAVLVRDTQVLDIAKASDGGFSSDPQEMYERWDELRAWAEQADFVNAVPVERADLENPVPRPRQVFAIGMNYRDHAEEASLPVPTDVVVFTKFVSSFAAPDATIVLPSDKVDYETELVAVIGREARDVPTGDGLSYIAGYAVGQDYSEREVQLSGTPPQFSLGKSFPGFSPIGPAVVSLDEFADPSGVKIRAELTRAGETTVLQDGTTASMVFSVARLVERLSQVVTLYPGDVIFTGTPAGVGMGRQLFLQPGDVLVSEIEGIGRISNSFVAAS